MQERGISVVDIHGKQRLTASSPIRFGLFITQSFSRASNGAPLSFLRHSVKNFIFQERENTLRMLRCSLKLHQRALRDLIEIIDMNRARWYPA